MKRIGFSAVMKRLQKSIKLHDKFVKSVIYCLTVTSYNLLPVPSVMIFEN